MSASDISVDRDTIVSGIMSQLSGRPQVPHTFRSVSDLDYSCGLISKRYQYLLELREKLGSTEAVIEYLENLKVRNSQQVINFPTNSIHPLTLVSPQVQTQFNGLLPLPTRVDLLTGANQIHPDYTGEPVLECELMTAEDVPIVSNAPQVVPIQFNLKRMRMKD